MGHSQIRCLAFQITVAWDEVLLSWGSLDACLTMRSSELIPCLTLFAHTVLLHLLISLSQPTNFAYFVLAIVSPFPLGV